MRMNGMKAVIKQRPAVRDINMVLNCAFVAVRWKWLDYYINVIVFVPRSSLARIVFLHSNDRKPDQTHFFLHWAVFSLSLSVSRYSSILILCVSSEWTISHSQSYRVIRYFSFLVELLCCRLCARVSRRFIQPFCTFCHAPAPSCYWLTQWMSDCSQ